MSGRRIVLVGGTGFIGGRLAPVLAAAGASIRLASRRPPAASDYEHVVCDLALGKGLEAALEGAHSAYFLVHGMAEGSGFAERELAAARNFGRAARAVGLGRVIYLGGLYPDGEPLSGHLASRRQVGLDLIESCGALAVRAGIIVGAGSASFDILVDLSRRLPLMIAPRWLNSLCQPISIGDAVGALAGALQVPGNREVDLVGPEVLSYRRMLEVTGEVMTGRTPVMVPVPVLSPELSALWLRLVTRADLNVARAIVSSLRHGLVATRPLLCDEVGMRPVGFRESVITALKERGA